MSTIFGTRRYLTNFDSARSSSVQADVLIFGTGIAGSRAALEAAKFGSVILACKQRFEDTATFRAQGGLAAAMSVDDSIESHVDDTLRVGCGLCNEQAVRLVVGEGPTRIQELIDWGLKADRDVDGLSLGREGGHTHHRIVHAQGDQTGQAVSGTLRDRILQNDQIRIFDGCYLIDLVTREEQCVGAIVYHAKYGHQIIWAKQTILATGGCGQLWRETTNPPEATGDGMAVAWRAGAKLCDMEFVQFHPTTLYIAGAGRALVSEAVRGEGAYLVDKAGQRFMQAHHADAELAPRDVVSRAIHTHLSQTRSNCVYLDVRHIKNIGDRFPHLAMLCKQFQLNIMKDLIPVRPSAHYMVGGINVDLNGDTDIGGLLCCGESASTGLHGANRLASNSLLEGLVFGRIAGETAGQRCASIGTDANTAHFVNELPPSRRSVLDLPDIRNSLHSVMWRNVGIIRTGDRLSDTCDILDFWGHYTMDKTLDNTAGWELQNQLTVARLVAMSALKRRESVGVHFREDAPQDSSTGMYHTHVCRADSDWAC